MKSSNFFLISGSVSQLRYTAHWIPRHIALANLVMLYQLHRWFIIDRIEFISVLSQYVFVIVYQYL